MLYSICYISLIYIYILIMLYLSYLYLYSLYIYILYWLRLRTRRRSRTAVATWIESLPGWLVGGTSASAGGATASGSSTSSGLRHFRHWALPARNWTRPQWSQRSTSRCSTGAIMVAILCVADGCQSGAPWRICLCRHVRCPYFDTWYLASQGESGLLLATRTE